MAEELRITAEQLAQRDEWDRRLMRKECTLEDALAMTMLIGVPASAYLVACYEAAIDTYKAGMVTDLAEPFGIAMGKREKDAMDRETWVSHVRFNVDSFHAQGYSKNHPASYDGTAFHMAAKMLHRSPMQIFDTYHGKRRVRGALLKSP